ncbi:lipoate--protein ligase family protein [Stetteria hydrogenophila]
MLVLVERGGSPHFNLAVEEALLGAVASEGIPVVRVWVNPASVVIGYSLEPCEEVDCEEAGRLGVPVVRRVSGGGAVYHDPGNVNVSLFIPGRLGVERLYRLGTGVVIGALARLGLEAHVENVNDVVVGEWKVSGSAAAVRAGASLFHATLLVEADMEALRRLVKPRLDRVARGEVTPAKYNPANVARLAPGVTLRDAVEALIDSALEALGARDPRRCPGEPGILAGARRAAARLYRVKYSTPHWAPVGRAWLEEGRLEACMEAGIPG